MAVFVGHLHPVEVSSDASPQEILKCKLVPSGFEHDGVPGDKKAHSLIATSYAYRISMPMNGTVLR